jgi:tetratricopeptide (TPR) repeat protein
LAKGNPDYEAGAVFFQKTDYLSAMHSFQLALKTVPNDSNVLYGMASCLSKLKRYSEARVFYEKILAAAPDSKLGKYSRDGLKYLDSVDSEGAPHQLSARKTFAQMPGPIAIDPGLTAYNPLPTPQPPSYFPPNGNSYGSPYQQNGGYSQPYFGNSFHNHRHQFGSYNQGGQIGPYTMNRQGQQYQSYGSGYMSPYHVPSLQIKEYSFAPSPSKEPVLSVELLAKQEKLVADEKPAR